MSTTDDKGLSEAAAVQHHSAAVRVTDLTVEFPVPGGGTLTALDRVNLTVRPGEFVAIVGPSGCGKSTLLRAVAGLAHYQGGSVQLATTRNRQSLGYVFQRDALMPWRTVLGNVCAPLQIAGMPRRQREERGRAQLARLGLADFERFLPAQLSGGMRQRVAIARALIYDPEVVFMDEPFGALDAQTKGVMQSMLLDVWELNKPTILFVTHDLSESVYLADRIVVMSKNPGRISRVIDVAIERPRPSPFDLVADSRYTRIHAELWEELRHDVIVK